MRFVSFALNLDQAQALLIRRFSAYAKTIFGIAIISLLASCGTENVKSTQERIDEEIIEKLAGWKARKEAACRTTAMEIAFVKADSMILEYAREQKLLIERPSRPIRPEEPELRRPNDTLKLAPFLKDSM